MKPVFLPSLPRKDFPLRPHKNGQWYRSVWISPLQKSQQFYFGTWASDPKGERALKDPQIGWLARKDAILAGVDNVRVDTPPGVEITLGQLMARFLAFKRAKTVAGELSLTTLGDYLREVKAFVAFLKPGTPAGRLRPEHFGGYMRHLTEDRKLGRRARKRVRAYVTAFMRFGSTNGYYALPNMGSEWAAPATDPDSMRQARIRAGETDYSNRIVTGGEVEQLLGRANPSFKAMIFLAVNVGLGPADIGRLRWEMINMQTGRMDFPRCKSGVARTGYLWKKTRHALKRAAR